MVRDTFIRRELQQSTAGGAQRSGSQGSVTGTLRALQPVAYSLWTLVSSLITWISTCSICKNAQHSVVFLVVVFSDRDWLHLNYWWGGSRYKGRSLGPSADVLNQKLQAGYAYVL